MSEILFNGAWTSDNLSAHHCYDESLAVQLGVLLRKDQSVVDLGAGLGLYTKFLREQGFNVRAFDGTPGIQNYTNGVVEELDLSRPFDIGVFDVVICLEVGEHIPAEFKNVFLDNITGAVREKLILSWGVPGQVGFGHVNCLSNADVVEEVESRGFRENCLTSNHLRLCSSLPWFKNTILVFDRLF